MDPRLNLSLADELAVLRRRVEDLERRSISSVGRNSISGSLAITSDDGTDTYARMGTISPDPATGAPRHGMEVGVDPNGLQYSTWFRSTENGHELPHISMPMVKLTEVVLVTSASFVPCWRATVNTLSSKHLAGSVPVTVPAGTAGEIRVGNPTNGYTDVKVAPSATSTIYLLAWELPASFSLGGGPYYFQVEARRTSGAGNVEVFTPALAFGRDANNGTDGWA